MFLTSINLTLMNKSTDKIQKAQELLYDWISHFDKRSLESIKKNCDYLNNIYELQLTNPIWGIFWPLVFNGVIDHIGNGYYALSSSIVLDFKTHSYFINASKVNQQSDKVLVGIELAGPLAETEYKVMRPVPLDILKTYPICLQFPYNARTIFLYRMKSVKFSIQPFVDNIVRRRCH